jgi:hypothetical protein
LLEFRYGDAMLEDALGILALYLFSLSATVVPCVLSEEGKGCSKDGFIAALQWGFSLGLFLHFLLMFDNQL